MIAVDQLIVAVTSGTPVRHPVGDQFQAASPLAEEPVDHRAPDVGQRGHQRVGAPENFAGLANPAVGQPRPVDPATYGCSTGWQFTEAWNAIDVSSAPVGRYNAGGTDGQGTERAG